MCCQLTIMSVKIPTHHLSAWTYFRTYLPNLTKIRSLQCTTNKMISIAHLQIHEQQHPTYARIWRGCFTAHMICEKNSTTYIQLDVDKDLVKNVHRHYSDRVGRYTVSASHRIASHRIRDRYKTVTVETTCNVFRRWV